MSDYRGAVSFLIGCVAVAVVIFALLGGIALIMRSGAAQVCAASGGQWVASDDVTQGGVDRVRECQP